MERGESLATESFYEDRVIDTPEAAERFAAMIKENKPYVSKGHKLKMASADILLDLAKELGYRES